MRIKLMSNWFAPDGQLRRKGEHEVPDDWKDQLPSSAEVLKAEKPAPAEKK